jgi:DNA (cytosine-5)-methyltransferase 1
LIKIKIRLFEAFAGIGTQALALKYLGLPYESVGISEIDTHALKSYGAIHGEAENYGDISTVKEIPQVDLFTYSFPCTDISTAGNMQGFREGSGTKSSLLWEVGRILDRQKEINKLPKVLLMENVKQLLGSRFVNDFYKWTDFLKNLGYTSYYKIMDARDYNVPQSRRRVFMLSLLGEESFTFPEKLPLTTTFQDLLEIDVDEKYYISDSLKRVLTTNSGNKFDRVGRTLGNMNRVNQHIANTITTRVDRGPFDNYIMEPHPEVVTIQNFREARVRKLTPKECWRLMGIKDEDFEKAERVCSNTQLYRQAGNAIVVNVLMEIFKNLYKGEEI